MRQITKDIEITIDGNAVGFRLTKLDAFSGVALLRLLMRLEGQTEQGDGFFVTRQRNERTVPDVPRAPPPVPPFRPAVPSIPL